MSLSTITDQGAIVEMIDRIDVHKVRLRVRLKSQEGSETTKPADEVAPTDDRFLSIPARGRCWLDEIIAGSVTDTEQIAARERRSVRHVNTTISLAFLAPKLARAAVEGRLPRGINIERLRDPPAKWSKQFEALGLNPQQ